MCVHGFKGIGYSPEYVKNFWKIFNELKDDNVEVSIVSGGDSICEPCPNLSENLCMPNRQLDEAKIQQLDEAYLHSLGVNSDSVVTWKDIKKKIIDNITDEIFEKNCSPCVWKKLGHCKRALEELREEHQENE